MTEPVDPSLARASLRATFEAAAASSLTPLERARIDLSEATRRVIEELITTVAGEDDVRGAAALVREAADLLAGREHGRPYDRPAEASLLGSDHRPFLYYSPFVGTMNALAPPIAIEWLDDAIVGRVTFGLAYEGPPGHVHGGFIAAGFDEVLGFVQTMSGQPGMTGKLSVAYRSPTPLARPLVYRARLERVEGRKVFVSATLHADEVLCAEAEGLFIAMKPEVFERLTAVRGWTRPEQ